MSVRSGLRQPDADGGAEQAGEHVAADERAQIAEHRLDRDV